MKYLPVILTIILSIASNASATEDLFMKAQAAYDDGRYAEAVMLYDRMVDNGIENVEVHYNLANASFKDGDLPKAVWHYRKAWYTAPRDPDIRANLHFALNAAGAVDPITGLPGRIFSTLSAPEWIAAAIAAYLWLTFMLILAVLWRSMRASLLKLSLIPAVLLLFALAGWRHWNQFEKYPEAVIVKTGTTALYGPVAGMTAHFDVPFAALVRQRGSDPKGWIEIEYDGKTGWIKTSNMLILYP